jgi:hypothetical protein
MPPVITRDPVAVVVLAVPAVKVTAPDEARPVKVPTEVMLVCAAVPKAPTRVVAVTCPLTPIPPVTTSDPVAVVVLAVPAVNVTAPDEARPVRVPSEVMLVCAAVANVPVTPPEKLAVVP